MAECPDCGCNDCEVVSRVKREDVGAWSGSIQPVEVVRFRCGFCGKEWREKLVDEEALRCDEDGEGERGGRPPGSAALCRGEQGAPVLSVSFVCRNCGAKMKVYRTDGLVQYLKCQGERCGRTRRVEKVRREV